MKHFIINYAQLQLCPIEPIMRVAPTFTDYDRRLFFWVHMARIFQGTMMIV